MAIQGKTDIDQLLAKSLKEIAVRRPVEKITIKEITDKAGVIRPTFYNHFQDKFELIEWIIRTELLEPVEPLIRNDMIIEAMVLLFTNIEKDKAFYSQLVKMEGPVKFHDIAKKCVREVLLELIQNESSGRVSKHKWLTPEVISSYYAQSMCFATEEWISMGMTISPREMAEAYQYMLSTPVEGTSANHWKRMSVKQRIAEHLKEVQANLGANSFEFTIFED